MFKKIVQTVTYMPHFISIVVICGIILDMVSTKGVITNLVVMLGITPMIVTVFILRIGE